MRCAVSQSPLSGFSTLTFDSIQAACAQFQDQPATCYISMSGPSRHCLQRDLTNFFPKMTHLLDPASRHYGARPPTVVRGLGCWEALSSAIRPSLLFTPSGLAIA